MRGNRPDFSDYVAHFCKDARPYGESEGAENEVYSKIPASAFDRLVGILQSKTVYATNMPWTGAKAVCLTECPWWSFPSHCDAYSAYGVGFAKPRIFATGGGPALYVKPDLFTKQGEFIHQEDCDIEKPRKGFHSHVYSFITPFLPGYAPKAYRDAHWENKSTCDYSHEREWRVPYDFKFEYDQVEFVVLATYEDMARFPKDLKDAIGREKFLLMEMYHQIERLWPTHIV
ncbi:MAG: terminase [Armatimonadetes bacterium]|nr:terminase [Armatimonadota bacterium]